MPTTSENITLHLGPDQKGEPDDLLTPIVEFIDAAKKGHHLMIASHEKLLLMKS